ncbi:phosphatidylserine decarboxylase [uncultured Clostridium sp.]|uniref:phosphatidylserine decarboxylase n=1 Tax=uncultured Clostridium sp. TaxID=59620 RepID=UPI0028E62238|nr:phosphatidylserine decarboxylase [uncultured Clostridium sp.]
MIKVFNRKTKNYDIEKVSGEKYLNWVYDTSIGISFLETFLKRKFFSYVYGKYCDSSYSSKKISSFVRDFDINMDEYEHTLDDFKSFNDFFIRKVKHKYRPIEHEKNVFISPGDGRISVYENIDLNKIVQIKGIYYSLDELIMNNKIASLYNNGTCIVLRLCPTDYHRFHFIDDGVCDSTTKIDGKYYSVNPVALKKIPKLFCQNKREWSLFHTDNFGKVLYLEVGATCVGSIIQTYLPNKKISKGDEKGYFKFGGSTVILFLEKDKVKIDEDIIEQTNLGYETKVLIGEKIGTKI